MTPKSWIRTRSSSKWITVRGTHEALVSRDLFQKVQAVLEEKASKSAASSKVPYTENVLRGKIFCGHCGKNLHRQRSHEKYMFHCISNDRIAKDYCSGSPRLWETELFGSILTIIQKEAAAVMDKKSPDAESRFQIGRANVRH